jgi:hypothetical protein
LGVTIFYENGIIFVKIYKNVPHKDSEKVSVRFLDLLRRRILNIRGSTGGGPYSVFFSFVAF